MFKTHAPASEFFSVIRLRPRANRYRSGRCREWIKVKNRAHPAFARAVLIALSKRAGSRSR
jgi:hypothetical protein